MLDLYVVLDNAEADYDLGVWFATCTPEQFEEWVEFAVTSLTISTGEQWERDPSLTHQSVIAKLGHEFFVGKDENL